jgi:hypothetical protein
MRLKHWIMTAPALALILIGGPPTGLQAQQGLPLDPVRPHGLAVSPIFEGWYRNPDGTYTLSFGYINRNSQEVLDIPVGPANQFTPGEADRGQPTHFLPRRHYGVFTVTVPADFGAREVVWSLEIRGQRFDIPGRIQGGYEIEPLHAPATGLSAPALRLDAEGAEGLGPRGVAAGPLAATVGDPLEVTVQALDEEGRQVTLRWAKFRGPGEVSFEPATIPVSRSDPEGSATTRVTFSAPGEYVLHVRAHNSTVASAGHAQCCWTNGFVSVTVGTGPTP